MIIGINHITIATNNVNKLEIHVGSWQTRIATKKANPGNWQNVEFFV